MSTILERRVVHCPYQRSRTQLEQMLREPAETGKSETLRLDAPMGSTNGASLHRDVTVTYGSATDPMHFDQPWRVHWEPRAGGPYPDFDGMLTVRADETYRTSLLELKGEYKPPLGVAGAAFDALMGWRVASATAQALLQKLAADIEEHYRSEENAKV